MTATCSVCEHVAAKETSEVVFESDRFLAFRSDRYPWGIVLATKTHNEGFWTMSSEEAAEFGPLAVKLGSAMIAEWTEHVYMVAYGEEVGHMHVMFMARASEVSAASHAAMQAYADSMTDRLDEAAAPAAAVRKRLEATPA